MNIRRERAAPARPAKPEPTPVPTPAEPGSQARRDNNDHWDDDEQAWRHEPVAPNDESPAQSFGRSVSDVVIGPDDATKDKHKP